MHSTLSFSPQSASRRAAKAQRALLVERLDCADANFGCWPNGDPILAEASIDGDADLYEIDGEAV
jgi:hypothetical protein